MADKNGSYDDGAFWAQVQSDSPTLLAFWNHNCAPCHVMAPIFERLGKRYRGRMEFIAVSVYDRPDIAQRFGVSSTPTLIITKRGKALRHFYGVIPEMSLDQHLGSYALPPPEPSAIEEQGFFTRILDRFGRRAGASNGS